MQLICPDCRVREKKILKGGKRSAYCRGCGNKRARESYQRRHEHYREKKINYWRTRSEADKRNSRLKSTYGITYEDYQRMFKQQGGVCAICVRPETTENSNGESNLLAVDHDHRTGKVRGLLCAACNKSLGGMYDDPERIYRMYEYALKHQEGQDVAS